MYYPQAFDKLTAGDKLSHRLFYFQGDDEYFTEDILKCIHGFYNGVQVLEAKPVEKEIIEKIKQTSLFDEEQLVIVRDIHKLDSFMTLLERIKKKDYINRLVLIASELPKTNKDSMADVFFRDLKKRSFYVDCSSISIFNTNRLGSMVKYFFTRAGANIADDAVELFVANTDMSNLRIVNNEAYRIATVFLGKTVTIPMLIQVLNRSPKLRLFALIKHISVKDTQQTLKIINNLMLDGCSVNSIIDYLYKFFKKVILLVDYMSNNKFPTNEGVAQELEIPLPIVPNYILAAKHYNIRKLYGVLQQLRLASVHLHQGMSPDYCVGNMVLKICRSSSKF